MMRQGRVHGRFAPLVDVLVRPDGDPHVLFTSRPLGLREDARGALQEFVRLIVRREAGEDEVRAWFERHARAGALTRVAPRAGVGWVVFPLILAVTGSPDPTVDARDLREVRFEFARTLQGRSR